MGVRRRVALVAVAFALGAAGGCKKPAPSTGDGGQPLDHLAPGDLPIGTDTAYGLPLPRDVHVDSRFGGVQASSSLSAEEIANFVRRRVKDGHVDAGPNATNFTNVVLVSNPKQVLNVEVRAVRGAGLRRSELLVFDATPPPMPSSRESDAERMKKVGLTPDGKLLDPSHMQ